MTDDCEPIKTITIFNCWQSDLCPATHRNAIRNALRNAGKTLGKRYPQMKIVIDEALRGSSGAPNIAIDVQERIEKADIVVADITTITPKGAERCCPNPNVTFELGFGVATVGWRRTVLLFNGKPLSGEVPFDFEQNRLSSYIMTDKMDESGRHALEKLIVKALRDIIEQDPKRPAEERGLSRQQVERQRDIRMVRWLMEHLHVPTVSQIVSMLPKHILDRHVWFYYYFCGVADSSSFHLYDNRLAEAVVALRDGWWRAMSEGEAYTDMRGAKGHVFTDRISGGAGDVGSARWDRIEAAASDMEDALQAILTRVRNDYLEIDIDVTNHTAWEEYRADMAEIEDDLAQ
ncbi:hypothetical protein JSE7799_01216 [Jannaschia seosinensis]|uniref:CD-NTase-associated protein 12/Pycsar effector protein TIR domain-containing protein n=1 Tax=Jannaschia seosinensis TaxID=313367 RepID=A0A0M7B817_9RHOB|nr:hypothetical protein [Jannaschia seosinensis]CUH36566.1 hypothetical protein JSE7799_01216 [Jannaschia seosinensis]